MSGLQSNYIFSKIDFTPRALVRKGITIGSVGIDAYFSNDNLFSNHTTNLFILYLEEKTFIIKKYSLVIPTLNFLFFLEFSLKPGKEEIFLP